MKLNFNVDAARLSLKGLGRLFDQDGLVRLGLFRPQYPPLALEMGVGRMTLVHVERQRKKETVVRRFRTVDLPQEALRLEFGRGTLQNPAQIAQALKHALEAEKIEARSISLVLPDHLARVSLIHLGERPAGRDETLELIRWKLRKAVPFRVEDAHIDYQVFPAPGDGAFTCLATLMQQSVLQQYEQLFQDLELHAGLIDLSSFSLVNLYLPVLAAEPGDAFVLNVTGSFFALLILRQGVPVFYRAKSFAFLSELGLASRQDLVLREVLSSFVYYRERLAGGEPRRLFLRCVDLAMEQVSATLRQKIGIEVVPIDASAVIQVTGSASGGERSRMLQQIAPALGAALGRDR